MSSTYIGDNAYGYPEFENEYSEMGNLIHLFKYRGKYDLLFDIIELAKPFIESWEVLNNVDFVLPVPPSKSRRYQPTQEIAAEIAALLNVGYSNEILEKLPSVESKGLTPEEKQKLQGSIIKTAQATKEHNMLLVDDLYKSGATITECIKVLRKDPKINKIYVLAMTKTRKGEMS
jgi:predicted amidophosphoribosyltransferase